MQFSKQSSFLQFVDVALSDLSDVAQQILEAQIHPVNVLDAPMGSGKTTLCNELVKAWGSEDAGSSPTFALIEEHYGPKGTLYHVDAYRIEDEEEALDMGIDEYFDSKNWCLIEWPENIENLLPLEALKIELTILEDQQRNIQIR